MSRKKKHKVTIRKISAAEVPSAQVVANDVLRDRRAEAARLKAQGAEVNADKRTGEILGAWRQDVFTIMRSRKGKPSAEYPKGKPSLSQRAYEAFRAHETDIQLAAGASGGERRPDFIRATTDGAPGQNITQEAIDAATRVKKTLQHLCPSDARLLSILMSGEKALAKNWRATVEAETGETADEGQTARIRALGENLIHARGVASAKPKTVANDAQPVEPYRKKVTWFRGPDFG
ncbi:MAG: hypothetical protein IE910_00805 [Brevundimonas sp.]|nr:hypothetical protein [Brevundimonas sp.]